MKTTKTTKTAKSMKPTINAEEVNWNARYYRDRAAAFFNSASYSAPSQPIAISMGKREKKALVKAGLVAVAKVRHNRPAASAVLSKHVIIGGIPHKRVDGKYVPLVAAAKSKKWDIIEPKKAKKAKK